MTKIRPKHCLADYRRPLLWLTVAILCVAVITQAILPLGAVASAAKLPESILSQDIAGATVRDLPLAQTELTREAVDTILGFSDYRYREFRSSEGDFSVYLVYWKSRSRHFTDVGMHAPDNCWVSNGFVMAPKLCNVNFSLPDGRVLWPAQARVFNANGQTISVIYWHLLAGETIDYKNYGNGRTFGFILDNLGHFWSGTKEQYFLRISSSLPLENWSENALYQKIMSELARSLPLQLKSQ
jgi:hypothetical protein